MQACDSREQNRVLCIIFFRKRGISLWVTTISTPTNLRYLATKLPYFNNSWHSFFLPEYKMQNSHNNTLSLLAYIIHTSDTEQNGHSASVISSDLLPCQGPQYSSLWSSTGFRSRSQTPICFLGLQGPLRTLLVSVVVRAQNSFFFSAIFFSPLMSPRNLPHSCTWWTYSSRGPS